MPEITSKKRQKEDEFNPVFVSKTEIDAEAKSVREARELPVTPADRVNFEAFVKWLKLLTPDMVEENRLLLYVYRLDPIIDRQRVDPTSDNNIDVISGTIDNLHNLSEEYFITRHGGGKYKIVVNDMENRHRGKIILECYLTIPVVQHPPKLDLREVIWDHKNNKGYKSWARANKLIDENDMPITVAIPQDTRVNGNSNPDQLVNALKLVMDFTKQMNADQEKAFRKQLGAEDQASKGIHDIILERLRQDDPNKQISTVSQLVGAMKTLMPEKTQSDLASVIPMFIEMMRQQADQANKQFQLMIEVLKKDGDNEGGEKRDEVSRLRDLIEIARELKGGGTTQKNVVAEVVDSIAPILQPALQIVANVMTLRAGQQAGLTVLPPQNNPPPLKPATVNRQDTIKHTPQPPNQPTPNPIPTPTPTPDVPIEMDEATILINQFKPIIMNKLAREGWEFGAWVAEGFGDAVAAQLARYGVEALLASCKKVPDFWEQVNATYGEPYLREWLTSLVNYKQIMKKMEQEEEDEELDIKEAI